MERYVVEQVDRNERYRCAVKALASGDYATALEGFLRVWSDTRGPDWEGFRQVLLVHDIAELVNAHALARSAFASVRDALDVRNADSCTEWLALNEALGEDGRSVAWFDGLPRPVPPEVPREPDGLLTRALIRHNRWADIAKLHPDPAGELEDWWTRTMPESFERLRTRHQRKNGCELNAEQRERMLETLRECGRRRAAVLVQACEAAGRPADAARLRLTALQLDPTAEMRRALGPRRRRQRR